MASRDVHKELADEIISSAFINSIRRFVAIRGKVTTVVHLDYGTNFVGSRDAINIKAINIKSKPVRKLFEEDGSIRVFKPHYASHM